LYCWRCCTKLCSPRQNFTKTKFEKVYIPFAGYDAGTAIGSALYLYNHKLGFPKNGLITNAYLGSKFTDAEIENSIKRLKESNMNYTMKPF